MQPLLRDRALPSINARTLTNSPRGLYELSTKIERERRMVYLDQMKNLSVGRRWRGSCTNPSRQSGLRQLWLDNMGKGYEACMLVCNRSKERYIELDDTT